MAFESLSDKMQRIFKKIKGQARITEANIDEMLKEIRIALLEADVNYKVVKEFVNNVKEKALGTEVLTKLNPGQMIVGIVHDEIEKLLGSNESEIASERNVSRAAIEDALQKGIQKLEEYEEALHLLENKEELLKIITKLKNEGLNPTQLQYVEEMERRIK